MTGRQAGLQLPEWLFSALVIEDPACAGADSELFFPAAEIKEEDGRKRRPRANYDAARMICAGCTGQGPCLEYAVVNHIPYGMWGGATPRERQAIRSRRRLEAEKEAA